MSSSPLPTQSAPSVPEARLHPLAPTPRAAARARSLVVRELAALALPRSVLVVRGARDRRSKRVALTFDDGPDEMTPRYLDVLARLGVRATFFLIGENAARAPGLVADYVRAGHEVGGHGWTHEPFRAMAGERLRDELARTSAILARGGAHGRLVRPPRGALSVASLLRIASAGYTTALWSVDSDDCRTDDARAVERRVAPDRLAPGDVVLLHELQPWTLAALPGIVAALRREAWQLVTMSELAG